MKNTAACLVLLLSLSCLKETPTIKHVKKTAPVLNLKILKLQNTKDPICDMSTADYLKDTAVYKGNTYGFCSVNCKKEFKKNPLKYAENAE